MLPVPVHAIDGGLRKAGVVEHGRAFALTNTMTYEREDSGVRGEVEGGRMDSLWWVPVDTVGYGRERITMPIIYVYDVIQLITL